jgi:hypothetical protein
VFACVFKSLLKCVVCATHGTFYTGRSRTVVQRRCTEPVDVEAAPAGGVEDSIVDTSVLFQPSLAMIVEENWTHGQSFHLAL